MQEKLENLISWHLVPLLLKGLKGGGLCQLSTADLIPSRQVRWRVYLSYLEVKQIGTIQQNRGQNLFYSQSFL